MWSLIIIRWGSVLIHILSCYGYLNIDKTSHSGKKMQINVKLAEEL